MDLKNKSVQTQKNKSFWQSFVHAISGIIFTFKHERNFRYHLAIGLLALIAAGLFQIKTNEWLWIITVIFIVFLSELWNTAAEYLVDLLVEKKFDPLAKRVKDVSAAIVLLAACLAIVVGLVIFVPYFFKIIK